MECEWRASEEYPVSAIAASSTEGNSVVFTANCDGEIKEWGSNDGGFRQMTILTVRLGMSRVLRELEISQIQEQ